MSDDLNDLEKVIDEETRRLLLYYQTQYFRSMHELTKANKGIRRLRAKNMRQKLELDHLKLIFLGVIPRPQNPPSGSP